MWVARNKKGKDSELILFRDKPNKNPYGKWIISVHHCGYEAQKFELPSELLPEVKWSDKEPTEVELVIKKK